MDDEKNPPVDEGQGDNAPENQDGQGEEKSWSKEEKAEYTRKTTKLAEAERMAEELGFGDDIRGCMEYLATEGLAKSISGDDKPEKPPDEKPDKAEEKPESDPVMAEIKKLNERIEKLSSERSKTAEPTKAEITARINRDWRLYEQGQGALEEESRNDYSKTQIMKYIQDPQNRPYLDKIAEQRHLNGMDINMFEIAAGLMSVTKSQADFTKKGAAVQKKIDSEADALKTPSNQGAGPKDKKTENVKLADDIAPDTNYVYSE